MIHKLSVVNLHKSSRNANLDARKQIVSETNSIIFRLIKTFGNSKFPSLDIWIGLTPGWHYETVMKDLINNKTVAVKCSNIEDVKKYIVCAMKSGVHSLKEQGEDQVFHFSGIEDQLSMSKYYR